MTAAITAATGFLIAVLWFDLMFDVQVVAHRGQPELPETVLESISSYYRRVTTDASPMGKLIAVVMVVLLGLLVWQAIDGETSGWVSIVSFIGAGASIVLAQVRVVPNAVRMGARTDTPEVRTKLARGLFVDHLAFIDLMVIVLVVQLVGG